MKNDLKILMIGPDPHVFGGIARVVRNWRDGGIFSDKTIGYLPSVKENTFFKGFFLLTALVRFVFICFQNPDMRIYVHTSSFNSFYRKSFFLFLAWLFGKKTILHIHPSHFYPFIRDFHGLKKYFFWGLLNRCLCFIVLTKGMRADMQPLFPQMPIHVLPNPVNVKAMTLNRYPAREANRFVFLGWFNRRKGVYDLVDAAALLAEKNIDFSIDFYGIKEVDQLKAHVAAKKMGARITVHGWADDPVKINALYRSAALILPSHSEGVPNVVLEAMATRTPVIATRVGGLADILEDGVNAIVIVAENPQNIAEKIEFVIHHRAYCEKMADNAFHEVQRKYDLPVNITHLRAILRQVSE